MSATKRITIAEQEVVTAVAAKKAGTFYTEEGLVQVLTFIDEVGEKNVLRFNTKSEMFKLLANNGSTVGEISQLTGSHYSFVYGVVSAAGLVHKKAGDSKSDRIREMAALHMTPGQISTALNSNYSFVHSVVKKYKAELAAAK